MLDDAAIAADVKICHRDFAERDLFDSKGARVEGYFTREVEQPEEDEPGSEKLHLHSPRRYAVGERIRNERTREDWVVAFVSNVEQAYIHVLRDAPAPAA